MTTNNLIAAALVAASLFTATAVVAQLTDEDLAEMGAVGKLLDRQTRRDHNNKCIMDAPENAGLKPGEIPNVVPANCLSTADKRRNTKTDEQIQAVMNTAKTMFGDGTFLVGTDIEVGTYRGNSSHGDNCMWERLSGMGGTFEDSIAFDNPTGPAIVTIKKTDKAFKSDGCGDWKKIKQ